MLGFPQFLPALPQGRSMADGAERREARRYTMSLPMRVLPHESQNRELSARTRDVSYRGLYFLSDVPFQVGAEIDFVLTLPQQVPHSAEVDIRCRGQVVRVETSSNGTAGIAAKIERYEFIPIAATAA
jgi:PilZ domain-containing protein